MNKESLTNQDKKYLKVIGEYLLKRIETDECLANKLAGAPDDVLVKEFDKVKAEARKQAIDGAACLTDDEVFEMVVHFILEDDFTQKEVTPKQNEKVETAQNAEIEPKQSQEQGEEEKDEQEVVQEEKPRKNENLKAKSKAKKVIEDQISLFDIEI